MSTRAYLERLGLDSTPPPTLATLRALHRAHLEQVPYENLDIMLGRPASVTPADSLARIVATGRAGYCLHHNAALELALRELGFDVERRHGQVWTDPAERDVAALNHLVLVVSGLPTAANPGGRWWPDAGLGEGFVEPLPLVAGTYVDGPLTFVLDDVDGAGWTLRNDPSGAFGAVDVTSRPADDGAVAAAHRALSTAPTGAFTRRLVVQRRTAGALGTVRGCVATTLDATGRHETDLATYDDWREALVTLDLALDDVEETDLRALFDRSWAEHRRWHEAGRP